MSPEPNALTDTIAFLTSPGWLTWAYWAMLILSILIAFSAWQRLPGQRDGYHLGRWALHVTIATMWWQGSLWKVPPDFDGLKYFCEQIAEHAAIAPQAWVFREVVLPYMGAFGWVVYLTEAAIAASMILGILTRTSALLGFGMAVNLWLGLYSAPGEWPWTYGYLVALQALFLMDPPGRYLGLESREETGRRR